MEAVSVHLAKATILATYQVSTYPQSLTLADTSLYALLRPDIKINPGGPSLGISQVIVRTALFRDLSGRLN